MASLVQASKYQFFDDSGAPLSGGKVYFYVPNTLTPKNTWEDIGQLSLNTNPVILDARGEATIFMAGLYDVELTDSLDNLIYTLSSVGLGGNQQWAGDLDITGDLTVDGDATINGDLFANGDNITVTPTGATEEQLLPDVLGRFKTLYDFGAVGDGIEDDTDAIQDAFDSSERTIFITKGTYLHTGVEIKTGSTVAKLVFLGGELKLSSDTDRTNLLISKQQFVTVQDPYLTSTGSKSDGKNTIGLKFAPSSSYMQILGRVRIDGFSNKAIMVPQCVNHLYGELDLIDNTWGLSLEKHATVPCTTVKVLGAYITGSTRGIYSEGSVGIQIYSPIFEFCGDDVSTDGALHIDGGSDITVFAPYFEANERNQVIDDAMVCTIGNATVFPGTSADVISYSGIAVDDRGTAKYRNNYLQVASIQPDVDSNLPCLFGTNIRAPVAGGSSEFGTMTTSESTVTATSATWTTIKSFTSAEMTGGGSERAAYRYTIYAGDADLTTGFNMGTIMNATIYSDTGSTPAWLRMSGNDLQVNVTSSSYGLNCKVSLFKIKPGSFT